MRVDSSPEDELCLLLARGQLSAEARELALARISHEEIEKGCHFMA